MEWGRHLCGLREQRAFTQAYVAQESGVGEKTISSFETGIRIASVKVVQLKRILGVYGITLEQFFAEVQP